MNRERFLSTEEVLAEARRREVELSERTLRYYVSLGLLPKPGRHPSEKADKRVLYFPARVLETLEQIRTLKDSGFTLEQIRQVLEGTAQPGLRDLAERRSHDAPWLAEKVVRALSSDEVRQAWRGFASSSGGASEDDLRGRGRDVYRHVLEALVGPEEAERAVARVFERLTPEQWQQKLAPLRRMAEANFQGAPGPAGSQLGQTLTSRLRDLARRILEGDPAPGVQRDLDEVGTRIAGLAAKYAAVPPSDPQRHEVAVFMGKALEVYGEAVARLAEAAEGRDPAAVAGAVARAQRAGEILAHLENLLFAKRELLRLVQEEDLRIP